MPRICIDLTANETFDRHGGITRYGWYLLEALVRHERVVAGDVELVALRHLDGPVLPALAALQDRGLDEPITDMNVWKRRRARRMGRVLRDAGVDLFHAVQPAALPLFRRGVRLVSTIHDLIPIVCPPDDSSAPARAKNRMRWTARTRAADAFIAISEQTARDLETHFSVDRSRVSVVLHGVDTARFFEADDGESTRARLGLPDRYLVSVGSDHERKNQPRLVEAFLAADADASLLLVGRTLYRDTFRRLAQTSERIVWRDDIADADLPAVYRAAVGAIAPSLYEGFGMTLLEAMACGVPVAAARNGAHEEVAADAALLFDGRDLGSIRTAVERLGNDPLDDLKAAGRRRADELSWDACATATLAAYERAL